MEWEARRFAHRVIAIHLAILFLVGIAVAWGARVLYSSAREQAIAQATRTQELLAKQTALSIQNYYESVTEATDLLQPPADEVRDDPSLTDADAVMPSATMPVRRNFVAARRQHIDTLISKRAALETAIWHGIQDKATMLLLIDPRDSMRIVKLIGADPASPKPEEVIAASRDWLLTVRHRSLSPFLQFGPQKTGAQLIAVPMRGAMGVLIVTLVPSSRMEKQVLQFVNSSADTGVLLIDESGTFISASRAGAVGHNIAELDDARTRMLANKYKKENFAGTVVFDSDETLGDVKFGRAMSTIEPVSVLGRNWVVVISSNLNEIEDFVRPVFHQVFTWAIVVGLAISGLLVSTAYQLIRGRNRLERMQRDVMAQEMSDARKIQLEWLPEGNLLTSDVHIAAINQPATHISGDFYDWFELHDGRMVVTIGDVTGHGLSAAFLMATTQLLVRNIMPRVADPAACLREVNRQMLRKTFAGQFVTLLIIVMNLPEGTMEVATAGHMPPLLGNGEKFTSLPIEPQLVLGVDADAEFSSQRFDLAGNESIVLYTDGAMDAQRPDGERFSTEGIAGSLFGRFESAELILSTVRNAVDAFRAGRDLPDDLTIVAIQLRRRVLATTPATADSV